MRLSDFEFTNSHCLWYEGKISEVVLDTGREMLLRLFDSMSVAKSERDDEVGGLAIRRPRDGGWTKARVKEAPQTPFFRGIMGQPRHLNGARIIG